MPHYSHVTLSVSSVVSHIWFMLRIAIMNNHLSSFLSRAKTLHVFINKKYELSLQGISYTYFLI